MFQRIDEAVEPIRSLLSLVIGNHKYLWSPPRQCIIEPVRPPIQLIHGDAVELNGANGLWTARADKLVD